MLTLGVDAHKRVHQAVAIDERGHVIATWRGGNHPAAWAELRSWAAELGAVRCWGIEGAHTFGHGLAQHLVAAGEAVFDVNPRLTAASAGGRVGAVRRIGWTPRRSPSCCRGRGRGRPCHA